MRGQRGTVLIIGLILMVIMTMIGLAGMNTTTQQERMSGNLRDRNSAFQAAELALRIGEQQVLNRTLPPAGAGFYDLSVSAERTNLDQDGNWGAGNAVPVAGVVGVAAPPEYMIEQLPPVRSDLGAGAVKDRPRFRISARGVGASASAVVVVQSVFGQ
ncbi:MAG: hypothetical protein KJZ96_00155 [Rhodocyclaceae bacterium]|nr:hypothetical protein [Rhodocyclaceae bacterium]